VSEKAPTQPETTTEKSVSLNRILQEMGGSGQPVQDRLVSALEALAAGNREEAREIAARALVIDRALYGKFSGIGHPERIEVTDLQIGEETIKAKLDYPNWEPVEIEVKFT